MAKKYLSKGFFITFEGTEGCGKSTHARLLFDRLKSSGYNCIFTREPGGTRIGEKIREILLDTKNRNVSPVTELMLFETCRNRVVEEIIAPALEKKKIVICDRFSDSTFVYQGYAGQIPLEKIESVDNMATLGIKPDLTIFIDTNVEDGLKRAGSRGKKDRMELKPLKYHLAVRRGYLSLLRRFPRRIKRVVIQDDINDTFGMVLSAVNAGLKKVTG